MDNASREGFRVVRRKESGGAGPKVKKLKSRKPEAAHPFALLALSRQTRISPFIAQMTQPVLPAWINTPASEASEEDRAAFIALAKDVGNLSVMTAVLERDPMWAGVNNDGFVRHMSATSSWLTTLFF